MSRIHDLIPENKYPKSLVFMQNLWHYSVEYIHSKDKTDKGDNQNTKLQ